MTLSADVLEALACPRCARAGVLADAGEHLRCGRCAGRYPVVGGLPCLVPDPALWLARWRARLEQYGAALDERVDRLRAEAALPGLLPRTRARVGRVAEALLHEQERVRGHAALLDGAAATEPGRAAALLPVRLTEEEVRAVVECDEHIHRDWAWGQEELDRLRAFVEELFATEGGAAAPPPGVLAAYGVGAGRLAVDVHRALRPRLTFAFDWNPLPLLVAERLLGGETVELQELPLWPGGDQDVVVARRLAYGGGAPAGFSFLIADALEPPFAPGSIDAALTVWFIDAVHADVGVLAARINRALRPGGLWVNAGPLRFKGPLAGTYSIEEVHELVERAGFALGARARRDLPYFASPVGGTRALETVFGFAARKTAEADPARAAAGSGGGAPWLADTRLPVPATPAMVRLQQSSIVAAGIISLVDGARSIAEISRVLGETWNMPVADVEPQVRAFFATTEP